MALVVVFRFLAHLLFSLVGVHYIVGDDNQGKRRTRSLDVRIMWRTYQQWKTTFPKCSSLGSLGLHHCCGQFCDFSWNRYIGQQAKVDQNADQI